MSAGEFASSIANRVSTRPSQNHYVKKNKTENPDICSNISLDHLNLKAKRLSLNSVSSSLQKPIHKTKKNPKIQKKITDFFPKISANQCDTLIKNNEDPKYPQVSKIDISYKDEQMNTILHLAANRSNNVNEIMQILNKCSNKNFICAENADNETALILAIKKNRKAMTDMLLEVYENNKIELNEKEKEMVFEMAVKDNNVSYIKYLYLFATDVIEEQHNILKKSIQKKFLNAVLFFLDCEQWQQIFRRNASDIQSPMKLIVIYMPETVKNIYYKCVEEGQREFFTELVDDYEEVEFSMTSDVLNVIGAIPTSLFAVVPGLGFLFHGIKNVLASEKNDTINANPVPSLDNQVASKDVHKRNSSRKPATNKTIKMN